MTQRDRDVKQAIDRKRSCSALNDLVSDGRLIRHFKDHVPLDPGEKLTLGTALLCDDPTLILALEQQLTLLLPKLDGGRRRQLIDNLLNDTNQFLHTVSELALAHQLDTEEWSVTLYHRFFNEKDVDILAKKDEITRNIEVINLEAEELPAPHNGFMEVPWEMSLDPRLVSKVVEKYQTKFEMAIDSGWSEEAWIALDYAKNYTVFLGLQTRDSILKDRWREACAAQVRRECRDLAGVIYYAHSAIHERTGLIKWTPCPIGD